MIIVDIKLVSAITGGHSNLGCLVIDNDGTGTSAYGNYNVRMYRASKKSVITRMHQGDKPFRRGKVMNHPRHKVPVQSLVLKALKELGYE